MASFTNLNLTQARGVDISPEPAYEDMYDFGDIAESMKTVVNAMNTISTDLGKAKKVEAEKAYAGRLGEYEADIKSLSEQINNSNIPDSKRAVLFNQINERYSDLDMSDRKAVSDAYLGGNYNKAQFDIREARLKEEQQTALELEEQQIKNLAESMPHNFQGLSPEQQLEKGRSVLKNAREAIEAVQIMKSEGASEEDRKWASTKINASVVPIIDEAFKTIGSSSKVTPSTLTSVKEQAAQGLAQYSGLTLSESRVAADMLFGDIEEAQERWFGGVKGTNEQQKALLENKVLLMKNDIAATPEGSLLLLLDNFPVIGDELSAAAKQGFTLAANKIFKGYIDAIDAEGKSVQRKPATDENTFKSFLRIGQNQLNKENPSDLDASAYANAGHNAAEQTGVSITKSQDTSSSSLANAMQNKSPEDKAVSANNMATVLAQNFAVGVKHLNSNTVSDDAKERVKQVLREDLKKSLAIELGLVKDSIKNDTAFSGSFSVGYDKTTGKAALYQHSKAPLRLPGTIKGEVSPTTILGFGNTPSRILDRYQENYKEVYDNAKIIFGPKELDAIWQETIEEVGLKDPIKVSEGSVSRTARAVGGAASDLLESAAEGAADIYSRGVGLARSAYSGIKGLGQRVKYGMIENQVQNDLNSDKPAKEIVRGRLEAEEGFEDEAYKDTAGKVTIGEGWNLEAFVKTSPEFQQAVKEAAPQFFNSLKEPLNEILKDENKWEKLSITEEEAEAIKNVYIDNVEASLRKAIPTFDTLPVEAQVALLDLGYHAGTGTLSGFKKMLSAISEGDMDTAAKELLDSKYGRTFKRRANLNARLLRGDLKKQTSEQKLRSIGAEPSPLSITTRAISKVLGN